MTPVERILSELEAYGCNPKQSGKGWQACCPAHEDRNPSLSISEGDDGKALVKCHAGCNVDAVCGALGMKVADLMAPNSVDIDITSRRQRKTEVVSTSTHGGSHASIHEAVSALERKYGRRSAMWVYHDANGQPVGGIVRWNRPDGEKDIRPVSRFPDGWRPAGMPAPRPLYQISTLCDAERVYICEGEKAAEAARSLGLVATTSAHGANSASKTDWSPLVGKECIILPDNDEAGEKYAEAVAAILAKLPAGTVVKVVRLSGLDEGDDIFDWVAKHPNSKASDLKREVDRLADETEPMQRPSRPTKRRKFQPFPVDVFPKPLRTFVVQGAKAIGCDPSYIALPLLTALAAAIGNSRRIQLKQGWTEPPILWAAIVGDSGSMKSPALELAMQAVRDRQRQAMADYEEARKHYEQDLQRYERDYATWRSLQEC